MEQAADLTEREQLLAHFHADALQLRFKVEMARGAFEAKCAAERAAAKATAKLHRRREQVGSQFVFLLRNQISMELTLQSSALNSCFLWCD